MKAEHMDELVGKSLSISLTNWVKQPCSFTTLRNGGSEAVLRAAVLSTIESKTDCIAFTEADGERVDAIMRSSQDGKIKSVFEFKHNFLTQTKEIGKNKENAIKQLRNFEALSEAQLFEAQLYYIHFLTGLGFNGQECSFVKLHNEYVRPDYKKFCSFGETQKQICRAKCKLGMDNNLKAFGAVVTENVRIEVYCAAFRVNQDSLIPICV